MIRASSLNIRMNDSSVAWSALIRLITANRMNEPSSTIFGASRPRSSRRRPSRSSRTYAAAARGSPPTSSPTSSRAPRPSVGAALAGCDGQLDPPEIDREHRVLGVDHLLRRTGGTSRSEENRRTNSRRGLRAFANSMERRGNRDPWRLLGLEDDVGVRVSNQRNPTISRVDVPEPVEDGRGLPGATCSRRPAGRAPRRDCRRARRRPRGPSRRSSARPRSRGAAGTCARRPPRRSSTRGARSPRTNGCIRQSRRPTANGGSATAGSRQGRTTATSRKPIGHPRLGRPTIIPRPVGRARTRTRTPSAARWRLAGARSR